MIAFRQMTLRERIKRLWPPYRRRRDEEMKAAIKELIQQPWKPCMVNGVLIPHGYGMAQRPLSEYDDHFDLLS